MPTIRFLARTIEAIKAPATGRTEYWDADTPGFGLRVSDVGTKTWIAMYRHGGRLRRLTLGRYPRMGLADARETATDALRAAGKGGDPAGEKKRARQAETFRELAEDYLSRYAKRRKRSWKKDEQAINRDLLPKFGRRKAADIGRRDVRQLLSEIVDRGAPVQANRTLEIVRRIYSWAIAEEIVEVNPAINIAKPGIERRRERVLTDHELRAVWIAMGAQSAVMAAHFKMRLVTGQRGGELAAMRWGDIDDSSGWLTLPAEISKNGLAHRVWLSEPARALLAERKVAAGASDWVFGSPSKKGPIRSIWKATAAIRESSGVAFRPHDLRRTVASRMTGDLGISRLVVSKILNHVETGVTSVYDRHSYDGEKKLAWEAWGQRLEQILANATRPDVVVPLDRSVRRA